MDNSSLKNDLKKPEPDIVLIDDNQHYLEMAQQLIQQKINRRVKTADTPYRARELVNHLSRATVFFVDFHLPSTTGLKLIEELKKYAQVPIECILVTAELDPKIHAEALRKGVYTFPKVPYRGGEEYNLGDMYLAMVEFAGKRLLEKVENVTDTITGAYTRKGGADMWVQVWNGIKRNHTTASAIFIDVDDFKQFNDRFKDHGPGDVMLCAVESRIRHHIRLTDIIVRYGDEFTVILSDTDEEKAKGIAERIKTDISRMKVEVLPGVSMSVSVSVGTASLGPHQLRNNPENSREIAILDYKDLIKWADKGMYQDKAVHKSHQRGKKRASPPDTTA